jgi:hypothetical protein
LGKNESLVKAEPPVSKPNQTKPNQVKATSHVFKKEERLSREFPTEQMKPTGIEKFGIGQQSANEGASAAAEFAVFGKLRSPNKALEPTTTSVTHPADAGCAPAAVAAHL